MMTILLGGGGIYEGLKIYSKAEFSALDKNFTNVLISSMYTSQMSKKAFELGFLKVYTFVNFLLKRDAEIFEFNKHKHNEKYIEQIKLLKNKFNDEESLKYLDVILNSTIQGKALHEITNICTNEPQYFLKSFIDRLNGINLVDAGAYTGDTLREMISLGIKPKNIYCFEADINNFQKLKAFQYDINYINNIYFENYALWNEKTFIGMSLNNYNARVDLKNEEKNIETIVIDEYFQFIPIGFIKMDIEGAERYALAGGMKSIKRDRPILAISIYHSLDDVVDIPNMLIENLNDYYWFIRKHSSTYSEAILYGLPNENLHD